MPTLSPADAKQLALSSAHRLIPASKACYKSPLCVSAFVCERQKNSYQTRMKSALALEIVTVFSAKIQLCNTTAVTNLDGNFMLWYSNRWILRAEL